MQRRGCIGTLVSSLVAFKRLHDDNILLEDAMPEFVAKRPARYRGKRLKDLCGEMHAFYRDAGVSEKADKGDAPEDEGSYVDYPEEASTETEESAAESTEQSAVSAEGRSDDSAK